MRSLALAVSFFASLCFTLVAGSPSFAADKLGQADLDKAVEARISAKSLAEVEEVITLTRSALKKGLEAEDQKFARELLAGVLFQRGQMFAMGVLEAVRPDPRLPEMRDAALDDLTEALEFRDNLPEAKLLIARLDLLPGGNPKVARKMLDDVAQAEDADAEFRSSAYMYLSALHEKPEERLADLDQAVELNPNNAQALRVRAALKLNLNKPAEAVADFDAALKIEPNNAATHEARGLALAAQEKWDDAKKSLGKAIELFPQSAGALIQRGRINMLAGDYKAAAADAAAVLKLAPDQPEALLLRSHARFSQGDSDGALEDINEVLEKHPNVPQALRTRIAINLGRQKRLEAIADLERLIKIEPGQTTTMLQLAAILNSLKRNVRAVELLDVVIDREPKNWQALRVRGDAQLGLGKHREAADDYAAALEIQPKDSGLLNNLAWLLATSPEEKVRDGKKSVELGTKACEETQFKEAHILSTLAAGYAEQGDFAAARKWIDKALEVAEGDEEKESLRKEQASYEAKKPWREKLDDTVAEPKADGNG
jgi:tetratricopeptide (TPR) repeat protein